MRAFLWIPAAITVSLFAPAAASAASAEITAEGCTPKYGCRYGVVYTADAGEANDVRVSGSDYSILIVDSGAEIRPGRGCAAIDAHQVRCTGGGFLSVALHLGDRDDAVSVGDPRTSVDGGAGDDRLQAGPRGARLAGGGGRDTLLGGPGEDVLADGDGAAGVIDSDVIDGGGGRDIVSYSDRRSSVVFAAGSASGGAMGEDDRLSGVEGASGGAGNDRLAAGHGGSFLSGGGGNDLLTGGPHRDVLAGGAGDDTLLGGDGRDSIDASEGDDWVDSGAGGDSIALSTGHSSAPTCGGDRDRVTLYGESTVGADCEIVDFGRPGDGRYAHLSAHPSRARAPVVTYRSACRRATCRRRVTLRSTASRRGMPAGTLLGTSATIRRSGPRTEVRLSPRGARLLRRYRRLPVKVLACERSVSGRVACTSFATTLRAPR